MSRQMARVVQSGPVLPHFPGSNGADPQVSAVSRFDDNEWDFCNEDRNPSSTIAAKKICWSFRMPRGGLFTDTPWHPLLTASKQFIYAVRWHPLDEPPSAPQSLTNLFGSLKQFIVHLVSYRNPILRFKDVLPHHCEDYIQGILGSTLSAARKYHLLHVVEKLFQYRQLMTDGLVADPFQGRMARRIVGYSHAARLEGQTEAIPEEILGRLVRASLEYVDRLADYLLDACEAVEDLRERQRQGSFPYWPRRWAREHAPATYGLDGTKLANGLSSVRHLNHELCYLQAACFVLIAFSTGMRVSEILSLQVGCCEIEKEPGQADLVWLRSRVFKLQGVPDGRSAKWLGGHLCARAVRILERLSRRTRREAKARCLWVPLSFSIHKSRSAEPLIGASIRYRLGVFATLLKLKNAKGRPFHLHPHMFRRTFARHVVRHDTTNLLALKEHFKHISLSMTDYYVGSDMELWTLMVEEEEKLLFESFDKALRADRMAGPGGTRLKTKIDEAIAEGRLPREFRGEAGSHLRKEMIRNLVESGQRVYPCAASNYCWFRPESALCTKGDQPLLKRCNPGACTNSIITPEHKPHWAKVQRDCEELLELKPQAEPYQKALRDIHTVSSKILRDLT